MSQSQLFSIENREVVRVKVKKCDGFMQPEYKKFCLDPQITSFEMLQNLLAKAFNIKGDFTISYVANDDSGEDVYLSLLSDWDLDAAFLGSSEPFLRLKVDLKPFEDGLTDWDIVARVDIPQPRVSQALDRSANIFNTITGTITHQVGRTVSQVQLALGIKEEDEESYLPTKPPMSDAEYHNFLDSDGRLVRPPEFRLSVYKGGVEPSLRRVVWRHLLNVFPTGLTGKERIDYMKCKAAEYEKLRQEWKDLFGNGTCSEEMSFIINMVKKDVLRTDRTHKFYAGTDDNKNVLSLFNVLVTYAITHPDVSYCQGMSDIASPLFVIQRDEASAYICFCALMNRLKCNFMFDGVAMTTKFQHLSELLQYHDAEFFAYLQMHDASDLFFCYRWLLLEVKREFPFDEALHMLEVMWSCLPPQPPVGHLLLSDPKYSIRRIPLSPASPVTKENVYTHLRTLRRRASYSSSLNSQAGNMNHSISPTKPCCASLPLVGEARKASLVCTPLNENNKLEYSLGLPEEMSTSLSDKVSTIENSLETTAKDNAQDMTAEDNVLNDNESIQGDSEQFGVEHTCETASNENVFNDKNIVSDMAALGNSVKLDSESVVKSSKEMLNAFDKAHNLIEMKSIFYVPVCTDGVTEEVLNEAQTEPLSPRVKHSSPLKIKQDRDKGAHLNDLIVEKENMFVEGQELRGNRDLLPSVAENSKFFLDSGFTEQAGDGNVSSAQKLDNGKNLVNPIHLPPPDEFGFGNPFLMFVCLTLLSQQRDHIMKNNMDYNDLAMLFDKMVRKHNVYKVLHKARSLYQEYLKDQQQFTEEQSSSDFDISV